MYSLFSNYVLIFRNLPLMSTVLEFTSSLSVKANTNKKCAKHISIRDDWGHSLKGHEISTSVFFHEPVSPKLLSIPLGPFRNLFENFRRYSQLKVHHQCHWHRWQMEKIFDQKSFNYFFRTPLSSGRNINFFLKFTLMWQQYDIIPTIFHRCRWHRRQLAASVVDAGGKFATSVVDTGRAPSLANISANFRTLMLFSGTWRKMIQGKNLTQKILWHCPFKYGVRFPQFIWAQCAQLISLTETPQPAPHLGSYTRALLVSQDRWKKISL